VDPSPDARLSAQTVERGKTVFGEWLVRGLSQAAVARVAASARRWWRNSAMAIHTALPNSLFEGLGLPRLVALSPSNLPVRTPACRVVWDGEPRGELGAPDPDT
jgi:hypothetical protein